MSAERTQGRVWSIESDVEIIEDHLHAQMLVAPNLANSLQVVANAAVWNNTGALVEFLAAGAVADIFDCHFASVVLNNNAEYQFGVYTGLGGAEVLVTSFTMSRTGVQERSFPVPIMMKRVPAGTRITVRCATSSSNADTANLKLWYHVY